MKTLRFNIKKITNLTCDKEYNCKTIIVGKYKFTLQDYKKQIGHDDSLPYSATLMLNGEPFALCYNNGWGGQTDVDILSGYNKVYEEFELYTKDCKYMYDNDERFIFNLHLDMIADILAYVCECES